VARTAYILKSPDARTGKAYRQGYIPGAMRKCRIAIARYLAFVVALLLVVMALDQAVANSSVVIGSLITSLPALVAWLYLESIAWEGMESDRGIVRGMAIASDQTDRAAREGTIEGRALR
jgi:hypothetical protein